MKRILSIVSLLLVTVTSWAGTSQFRGVFTESLVGSITASSAPTGLSPSAGVVLNPMVSGSVANGTTNDQASYCYVSQVTLAPSGTTTINLNTMSGASDAIGNAFSVTHIKYLAILIQGNLGCTTISSVTNVVAGGTSYAVNDILVANGGTGIATAFKVLAVSSGAITSVSVVTNGSYTASPSTLLTPTGGSGSGAQLGVAWQTVTASTPPVYVESDYLTIGGIGTTAAWTSWLSPNSATLTEYSGTVGNPGLIKVQDFGGVGFAVGSSTTNHDLKLVNSGANPVTFLLVVVGS